MWTAIGMAGAAVAVVLTTGCDALRDAFSPRAEIAARANAQTLSVVRLGDLAGNAKQLPLEARAVSRLASVWVDYALLAQALAANEDLRDSATMAAAMWPLVSQLKWERFHDEVIARQTDFSGARLDSAYRAGELRLFQHILFTV
ncbi:MAG: hypothetical protein ACREME_11030, partial [Gemmatimonadales bacterium]